MYIRVDAIEGMITSADEENEVEQCKNSQNAKIGKAEKQKTNKETRN